MAVLPLLNRFSYEVTMSIPLLEYTPISRNHRVAKFEVPGDEAPRVFNTEIASSNSEMEDLIQAAYRQVFNEQQMLASHRQRELESQLRSGQLSVQGFMRGLALSPSFRRLNYESNNNYRFAQMCVQRLLGRDVYSDREKISWSIVLATQGLNGFIDSLLTSTEYQEAFGENTVPYQRRRILPQRVKGEVSFAHMPRYGKDHLVTLEQLGNRYSETGRGWSSPNFTVDYNWRPPQSSRQVGAALTYAGAAFVGFLALGTVLSWFGFISF
jgi:phycobilisome rod-core linker protein